MPINPPGNSTINNPKPYSSVKNRTAWVWGWLPAAIGLVTWILSDFDFAGKGFGIFIAIAISVTVHEIAHFAAGRIFGLKPWCLRIGHGEIVFDKEFHSFRLVLQSLPYSGAVYPYLPGTRSRQFAMTLAGPLSNAVLFLIFLLSLPQTTVLPDYNTIPMQMLVANGYLLLISLVPYYSRVGPNDAMIMIHLLRGTSPKPSANKLPQELTPSWSWTVKHEPAEILLNPFREYLNNPKLSPEQRSLILDEFATCVLMYGASEFLAEADTYSDELVRLKPDDWSVKGTRGAVLVEKGDLPEGITMLEEVMANDSNPFDRVISSSYLALAKWKQGDSKEALRWLAMARAIDPQCPSTVRIGALMKSKTAP